MQKIKLRKVLEMLKNVKYVVFFLAAAICLTACAKNGNAAGQQGDVQQAESTEADEPQQAPDSGEEEKWDTSETHLELVGMKDDTPFYLLTFKKIEGGTGNELPFEGNTDPDSDAQRVPDNVSVEPQDSIIELQYHFDGDENLADAVTIAFWSRGDADSFLITLDGLEYTLPVPETEGKEISQKQEINLDGAAALLESATVYPHALLLELTGVDEEFWQQCQQKVFLLTENGNDVGAARVYYEESSGTVLLLHEWEIGVPEDGVSLRIKSLGADAEEYQDYPVILK